MASNYIFALHLLACPRSSPSSCHPTWWCSSEATPPWWLSPLWSRDSGRAAPLCVPVRTTTVWTPPPHQGCTPWGDGRQQQTLSECPPQYYPVAFWNSSPTSSAPMCSVLRPGCSFTTCLSISMTKFLPSSLCGFRVPTQYGASLRLHRRRCFNTNWSTERKRLEVVTVKFKLNPPHRKMWILWK